MLMGRTFRFSAISLTRARRWKLSSLYQQRTSSGSSVLSGGARPGGKKPGDWLDQAKSGVCVRSNHEREGGSEAVMQPAHGGLTMRAREKLLLTQAKPLLLFFAA